MKTHYTLGFLFSLDKTQVLTVRKKRPLWQFNRLNGVGGHTNPDEVALACMNRELREEVWYPHAQDPAWVYYCRLETTEYIMDCFTAIADVSSIKSRGDEQVEIVDVTSINPLRKSDLVPNTNWLIATAAECVDSDKPLFFQVTYQ